MDVWELARSKQSTLRISTLVSAEQFRKTLTDEAAMRSAVDWCRQNGVTRVFLESYRGSYTAPRNLVEQCRDMMNAVGIEAAGGITTTRLGRDSTGWNIISCYTDPKTVERLQHEFEYAASMFNLIMIDDFWFTDCECPDCTAAKGNRSWSEFRMELMGQLSRERILGPAKRVSPCKVIIKYPQWYDRFHLRGYDVVQQTKDFDYTWVGTELRDPNHTDKSVPVVLQYEGFWVMRWLLGIGGQKCLGGWFDEIATSPPNYLEQAWQTILGGAPEMLLFTYGSLIRPNGVRNLEALRPQLPALFELAEMVRSRPLTVGVQSPKPPHSEPGDGRYIYDHIGMLGLPLIPSTELDPSAKSAFLSAENLKDPLIAQRLQKMLDNGGRVVATDGLLGGLSWTVDHPNLLRLDVRGTPPSLLNLPGEQLTKIRQHLLEPLGLEFAAPARVAMTVLGDDLVAVSNFSEEAAEIRLRLGGREGRAVLTVPHTHREGKMPIPPRSLTVYQF